MDATAIALKLNDCLTEMPGDRELWQDVCTRYPFFGAARMMDYACRPDEEGALPMAALFKNDPYLFAAWVHTASFRTLEAPEQLPEEVVASPEASEPLIVAVDRSDSLSLHETPESPAEDILTLINELPNSNPIAESKPLRLSETEPVVKREEEPAQPAEDPDRSLMVMMSFTDWLTYFKTKRELEQEEERDKKALKTSWQKEKLAAAVEEDVDEIPEPIFRQAMDSISSGPEILSEGLAKILAAQGKTDRAIDMYKKLSLRNPEKRSYFADLIEQLNSNRD